MRSIFHEPPFVAFGIVVNHNRAAAWLKRPSARYRPIARSAARFPSGARHAERPGTGASVALLQQQRIPTEFAIDEPQAGALVEGYVAAEASVRSQMGAILRPDHVVRRVHEHPPAGSKIRGQFARRGRRIRHVLQHIEAHDGVESAGFRQAALRRARSSLVAP